MNSIIRAATRCTIAAALLLVPLVACGDNEAGTAGGSDTTRSGRPAAAAASEARSGDTSSAASATTPAEEMEVRLEGIDSTALANYRLDMRKVNGLVQAARNLQELERRRPDLKDSVNVGQNAGPEAIVRHINRHPEVRRAITSAGISPRDYVLTTVALLQALMVHGMREAGADVPSIANEANVRFVAEHEQEIQGVLEELSNEAEKAGATKQ